MAKINLPKLPVSYPYPQELLVCSTQRFSFFCATQLTSIWRHIPHRMTMGTPELAYASNNDGMSLTTFYAKSERFEPTVLVIKTTTREVRRDLTCLAGSKKRWQASRLPTLIFADFHIQNCLLPWQFSALK